MTEFRVFPFSPEDAAAVRELDRRTFSVPIPDSLLEELPEKENMAFFVVKNDENTFCGYAGMMFVLDEAEVISVAVKEEFRGLGCGTLLMDALLEKCYEKEMSTLSLEVREGNAPARRLYEKVGFTLEGVRKNYYSNPKENALIMTRLLKQR